jgi:hypothetical protein
VALLWAGAARADDVATAPDPAAAAAIVTALLEAARTHSADAAFIAATVDPGPQLDRWLHVLRPYGDLERALNSSRGVVRVDVEGDAVRALLATAPPLAVVVRDVEGTLRITAIEAPACSHCDPRQRWVEDLIAEVRRHGTLRDRLQPDLELMRGDDEPDSRWETWSAALESRLHVDQAVAAALAGAEVLGTDDDVVLLRYADGAEDRWHIIPTARGWGVVYDDLAASSPLRLSAGEARRWRKVQVRQEVGVATWAPSWRTLTGGAGQVIGHRVVDAAWQPADDTVLLTVLDGTAPWGAWFQLDVDRREVTARWPAPLPDYGRAEVRAGPGGWRAASGDGAAALYAMGGMWTLTPAAEAPVVAVDRPGRVKTLILDGPTPRWVDNEGDLWPAIDGLGPVGEVVALWSDGRAAEVVLPDGAVRRSGPAGWRDPVPACPGGATAAARRPSDGAWLVVCAAGDAAFAIVHQPGDVVVGYGERAWGGTVAAWSGTGRRLAVAAPPDLGAGVLIWDLLDDEPDLTLDLPGVAKAVFSPDDDRLITVSEAGLAILWDLGLARRARAVRVVAAP